MNRVQLSVFVCLSMHMCGVSSSATSHPFNIGDRKRVAYDPKLIIRLTYKNERDGEMEDCWIRMNSSKWKPVGWGTGQHDRYSLAYDKWWPWRRLYCSEYRREDLPSSRPAMYINSLPVGQHLSGWKTEVWTRHNQPHTLTHAVKSRQFYLHF